MVPNFFLKIKIPLKIICFTPSRKQSDDVTHAKNDKSTDINKEIEYTLDVYAMRLKIINFCHIHSAFEWQNPYPPPLFRSFQLKFFELFYI